MRSPGVVCAFLALITLLVFCQVARHDFVNYDDPDYVSSNLHVQTGISCDNLAWAFTSGHASNWHPLTWISHMIDWHLFGSYAGGHLLVNIGLHIVNSLLVFLVLRRLTGAHWRSALVAALFALHPVHVESVAWISERKDVLSTLFFLLTIGAYGEYVSRVPHAQEPGSSPGPEARGPKSQTQPSKRGPARAPGSAGSTVVRGQAALFYALALGFFALGLMSKPMLVTLPFVLLLLDYWPLDRFSFFTGASFSGRHPIASLPRLLVEKLPFFALSVASSVVTFLVQRHGGAVSTSISLAGRIANALVSYVRYIGKMFWPENLSVLYPHPGYWPAWQVALAAVFLALVTAAILLMGRRRAWLPVGWFWFLGTLVPVIGLVQVGIQSMADRYTYVPLLGLFVIVTWLLEEATERWRWRPVGVAVGSAAVVLLCAGLTFRQVRFWKDSEALFQHAVKVTPRNYLAYNNLGFFLSNKGRVDESIEYYRKSLEIKPDYEDALNNMGYALAAKKKPREAITYYEAALRVRPNHVEVHNNLGNALSELGQIDEAIEHYRFALRQKPDHGDAHNNLGIALAMQGKLEEAVGHFRDALRFKPNYASAHSNLGNALAVQRKFDQAIAEYQECLRLNPKDPQAHNNLANVLAEQGQLDDAIAHYNDALRLNPNNAEAHVNLGLTLARQGKSQEAERHYAEALRLNPDYTAARELLKKVSAPR